MLGWRETPCEKSGRRRAMGLNIEHHHANGVSMGSTACAAYKYPQRTFLYEFPGGGNKSKINMLTLWEKVEKG